MSELGESKASPSRATKKIRESDGTRRSERRYPFPRSGAGARQIPVSSVEEFVCCLQSSPKTPALKTLTHTRVEPLARGKHPRRLGVTVCKVGANPSYGPTCIRYWREELDIHQEGRPPQLTVQFVPIRSTREYTLLPCIWSSRRRRRKPGRYSQPKFG
jgi:hypothetical protein